MFTGFLLLKPYKQNDKISLKNCIGGEQMKTNVFKKSISIILALFIAVSNFAQLGAMAVGEVPNYVKGTPGTFYAMIEGLMNGTANPATGKAVTVAENNADGSYKLDTNGNPIIYAKDGAGNQNIYESYSLTCPKIGLAKAYTGNPATTIMSNQMDTIKATAATVKTWLSNKPTGKRKIYLDQDIMKWVVSSSNMLWVKEDVAVIMRNALTMFFKELATIGGQLDELSIDWEWYGPGMGFWENTPNTKAYWLTLENDPRFETDVKPKLDHLGWETKPGEPYMYYMYNGEEDIAKQEKNMYIFSDVNNEMQAEPLNKLFYFPAKQYYPDISFINYGCLKKNGDYKTIDLSGYYNSSYGEGQLLGNKSAPDLYGWLWQAGTRPPEGLDSLEKTPFNGFLHDQNYMRQVTLSDPGTKVTPFIAFPRFDYFEAEGGTYATPKYGQINYYYENILHTGLNNPEMFMGWLTPQTSWNIYGYNWTNQDDIATISKTFRELDELVGFKDKTTLNTDLVSYTSNYVLSGMSANNNNVWRLTPDLLVNAITREEFIKQKEITTPFTTEIRDNFELSLANIEKSKYGWTDTGSALITKYKTAIGWVNLPAAGNTKDLNNGLYNSYPAQNLQYQYELFLKNSYFDAQYQAYLQGVMNGFKTSTGNLNPTFKIGDETIAFPTGSYIYTPTETMTNYGFWIISPKGTTPIANGKAIKINKDAFSDLVIAAAEKKSANVVIANNKATLGNGDYVEIKDVDFGIGTKKADIKVSASGAGGTVELWLDRPTVDAKGKPYGTLLGKKVITATGDQTVSIDLPNGTFNKHHLIIKYVSSGAEKVVFDTIKFTISSTALEHTKFGVDIENPIWGDKTVTTTNITNNSVKLQWVKATDNHIVEGYNVYKIEDGKKVLISEVSGELNEYTVVGLEPGCTYTFAIEAFDRGGKETTDGPSATVATSGTKDTVKPVWGANAVTKDIRATVCFLSWNAPADSTKIAKYNIYKAGTLLATVEGKTTYQVFGLLPNTNYDVKIEAVDAAGNISDKIDASFQTKAGSLAGKWTLSSTDGTSEIADLTGKGNSGIPINVSKTAGALTLNAASQSYVNFGNKPEFNPGNQGFTASIWFKKTSTSANSGYLIGKGNTGYYTGWGIQFYNDKLLITYNNGDNRASVETIATAFSSSDISNWHNLALVIDRTTNTIKGYIDGVYDSTKWKQSVSGSETLTDKTGTQLAADSANDLLVGATTDYLNNPFRFITGMVDGFAIYDYNLSDAEMLNLFNTTKPTVGTTVLPTGVTLDRTTVDLKKGQSDKLIATIAPADATNKDVTWSSSVPTFVSVATDGTITAMSSIPVASVVTKTSTGLVVGGTETLTATTTPTYATNQNVKWSSSNPSVATVNEDTGLVTAISVGTAVITATTVDGNKVSSGCTVAVAAAASNPTAMSISKTTTTLWIGYSEVIRTTFTATTATNQNVTWTSDKPTIATVDANGRITAISEGTANITAKSVGNSSLSKTCIVTVSKYPSAVITATSKALSTVKATCTVSVLTSEIVIRKASSTIEVGKDETLIYDATGSVTWSSSDSAIAEVDQNGKVLAKAEGQVTVSATVGTTVAKCIVTVIKPVKATSITIDPISPIARTRNDLSITHTYIGPRHHDFYTLTTTTQTDMQKLNKLTATVYPVNSTSKIYWKSLNVNSVIIDNKTGIFKLLKPGVAKIQAIAVNFEAGKTDNQCITDYNNVVAEYTITVLPENLTQYTVTFNGKDGTKIADVLVFAGMAATAPTPPVISGWKFTDWDKAFDNITSDLVVNAIYEQIAIPAKPNTPTADSKTSTTIKISWLAVALADNYNIYVNGNKFNVDTVTGLEYNITGLTKSTAYTIKITAVNVAGESVLSDALVVTTLSVLKGDVNGDGDITIVDAMKVFQSLSGKTPPLVGDEKEAADINGDGEVTIVDAMKIFQYLSGKIPTL